MPDRAHRRVRFWVGTEGTEIQTKLRRIIAEHHMTVSRIAGLMLVESGGQHEVISSAGAVGLGQVMPSDGQARFGDMFADRPTTDQLKVPCVNIYWTCKILRDCFIRWGQDWSRAHAAYLGGIGNNGVITAEGQHYVDMVLAAIEQFRGLDQ